MALYVIDVGVESPQNVALGRFAAVGRFAREKHAAEFGNRNGLHGPAEDRTVRPGSSMPTASRKCGLKPPPSAQPDQSQAVEFQIDGLEQGTHQGYVRIAGEDSLPADDVRYFTVEVRPPWKVLVVAPKPAQRRAMFLTEALAPAAFRRTGQARFECDVISFDDLATKPLDDYAAVCLLDPPPLADAVWQTLANYVDRGGGLADLVGAQRAAQRPLGRRFQHAGRAKSDARQTGAAVASARCVPGAARLSASAVGQIPQHHRQRAVGCIHRLVALETWPTWPKA